ncbi:MAG: response regulator [Acidobacteria bacterium]|nr:response regulator [Acidobacteriota bacterium]MBA3888810.1 response regulator [Acidobacteriota bacterium]
MAVRLLLADDSVTIQRVIELTFADEDIDVVAVGDGRAAIESIQGSRPDIILADIGMPERDGYEVAAFVKGDPALAGIPVLLLTGAFEPVDEARVRAVGCDGVLVKPFEPQMVISRVKDLLAGRRPEGLWASPAAQSPVRQTHPPRELEPGNAAREEPSSAPGGALEDYFDRLDAAFALMNTGPPSSPVAASAPGGSPLEISPSATHPSEPGEREAEPGAAGARVERVVVPDGRAPSLAEAFSALLAAEQGQPFSAAPGSATPEPISESVIEAIVERVVGRMAEQAVRETVLDVAERLVREEIDRIKASSVTPT